MALRQDPPGQVSPEAAALEADADTRPAGVPTDPVHGSADEIVVDAALAPSMASGGVGEDAASARGDARWFSARIAVVIDLTCRYVIAAAIVLACGLEFASIVHRAVAGAGIIWAADAIELCLAVIAFVGAVTAYVHRDHIGMKGYGLRLIGGRARLEVEAAIQLLIAVFAAFLFWQAFELSTAPTLGTFGALGWSTNLLYVPLAVGGGLLALVAGLRGLFGAETGVPWFGMAGLAVLLVVGRFVAEQIQSAAPAGAIIAVVVVLILSMAAGVPVAFSFGFAAFAGIVCYGGLDTSQFALQMTSKMRGVTLVSLPFFILAGTFLGRGDIPDRIMALVRKLSGYGRAGDCAAAVVSMYLFSGLSGSKIGDVAAVAPTLMGDRSKADITAPPTDRESEMTAIFCASATMGEAVPPSTAILVLASVTSVSTIGLFMAGLIPAAVCGLCIIGLAVVRARRGASWDLDRGHLNPSWASAVFRALPAFGGIVLILGGIVGGFATPSEASAVAVVYSAVVLLLFYRVGWRSFLDGILLAARLSGMLLFLIALTSVLTWFLTITDVAAYLADLSTLLGNNPTAYMAMSIVLSIVLGSIFEGVPHILLFAPIFIPQAVALGINDLHFAIVFLLAHGIGVFIPPIGIGFYSVCGVLRVRPEGTMRRTVIYKLVNVVGVVIVAFVPALCTWLPQLVD